MVHFNEIPPSTKAGVTVGSNSFQTAGKPAKISEEQKQALLQFARNHMQTNNNSSQSFDLSKLNMDAQIKLNDVKAQKKLSPAEYIEYKQIQDKANSKSYDAEAIRQWNEKHPDLKIVTQYQDFIYPKEE
ncbi:hypothetical protein IKP85_04085 [bacterium]|nr:hypothetical protein [bacterium]